MTRTPLQQALKRIVVALLLVLSPLALAAGGLDFAAANDATWDSLGTNENSSMPLGNGDLAVNVWTEQNGDIVLLLAKADAWSENGQLLKLGRVRVRVTPSPFAAGESFTQTLKLDSAEVQVRAGKSLARIWVDANHPVARVEIQGEKPVQIEAKPEVWHMKAYHLGQREVSQAGFFEWGNNPEGLNFLPDAVLPARPDRISWCHFNSNSIYPLVFQREHLESLLPKYPDPLLHRCFGIVLKGPGLAGRDSQVLVSKQPARSWRLDLYALTQQSDSPGAWARALDETIAATEAVGIDSARKAHQRWWAAFWNRSWLHVSGTPEAGRVSQSYAMQRYMTACAGRGAQPIKFNGSLFTVGHDLPEGASSTEKDHDPDFRAWGASYWNQNTRWVYWPLLATGDYDLLSPWFNMYVRALPLAKDRIRPASITTEGPLLKRYIFGGCLT